MQVSVRYDLIRSSLNVRKYETYLNSERADRNIEEYSLLEYRAGPAASVSRIEVIYSSGNLDVGVNHAMHMRASYRDFATLYRR